MDRRGASPRECARIYGISYGKLKQLCRSGAVTPHRVGCRSVILFTELEAYISAQPKTATPKRSEQWPNHISI